MATNIFSYIGGFYVIYYVGNVIYDLYKSNSRDVSSNNQDEIIEVSMPSYFDEKPITAEDVYSSSLKKEKREQPSEQVLNKEDVSHSLKTDTVSIPQEILQQDVEQLSEQVLNKEDVSHSLKTDTVSVPQEIIQQDVENHNCNVTVHGGYSIYKMQSLIKDAINKPEDNPFIGLSQF